MVKSTLNMVQSCSQHGVVTAQGMARLQYASFNNRHSVLSTFIVQVTVDVHELDIRRSVVYAQCFPLLPASPFNPMQTICK